MYSKYKMIIAKFDPKSFPANAPSQPELRIPSYCDTKTVAYYAPFDHINREARVLFVGITPGREQMNNALRAACEAIRAGMSDTETLRSTKRKASFSGEMRQNLVSTLNHFGFHSRYSLSTCHELWEDADHLAHFTSALKFPVFTLSGTKEANYTGGSPDLNKYTPFRERLREIANDLKAVPNAFVLPLGDKVASAIQRLVDEGVIPLSRVLNAESQVAEFPHPSPSNKESQNLALSQSLETKDAYAERMYANYVEKPRTVGKPMKEKRSYFNTRYSYWKRARLTRLALDALR